MADVIQMPKLGLTMREGLITEWLVARGAEATAGEPLCRIETEKVVVDFESPMSGVLLRHVDVGTILAVGQPIAIVGSTGEDLTAFDDLPGFRTGI